jgi:hypothetical protein
MQIELLRPLWPDYDLRVVHGVRPAPGHLLCGAQGKACRLRECRCSEALAELWRAWSKAPNDPHAVFTWSPQADTHA